MFILIFIIPFFVYSEDCTKMVNGVVVPCTQAEIEQRRQDSITAVFTAYYDSLANIEATRIRNAAILINGTPYSQLTAEQRYTMQLYLLLKTGNLDLVNKTVDIK